MQLLGILGKLDFKVILSLFVALLSLLIVFLTGQNAKLKEQLGIAQLEIAVKTDNQNKLLESLEKQNDAFKALKVSQTQANTQGIEKITLKDSTCQAELKAYKELFKELSK